jgi:hypothetical protein
MLPLRVDSRLPFGGGLGNWNTIYRRFRRLSEAGVREVVSVTLAEVMADSGHYSIDSATPDASSTGVLPRPCC